MRGCLALILFALAGCSSTSSDGEVSGSVSVDGQPAENGAISFFPLDGRGPTGGCAITAGRYSVRLPVGAYRVEVRVSVKVGERKLYDTPDSPVQPTFREILPAKYNIDSELKYDVIAGPQEKNWDLPTK
jgi:hypothetical protein